MSRFAKGRMSHGSGRAALGIVAAAALVASATLAGCEEGRGVGEAAPAGFETTDSAGVEIVRSDIRGGAVPSLSLVEDLRIGSLDGPPETQLFQIRPPEVAPDGSILVPLLREGEIRVFAPDGAYLRTIGRVGEGPGEFQGLSRVYMAPGGDRIVAVDARIYRTTTFSRDGEVLGTAPLPRVEAGGSGFLMLAGAAETGWVLTAQHPYDWPQHGAHVEMASRLIVVAGEPDVGEALRLGAALVDGSGPPGVGELAPRATVAAEYRWGRMFGMRMGEALTGQRALWEPTESWAVDGRGRLHVSAGRRYRIDAYDSAGELVRRLEVTHEEAPITQDHVRGFLAHARAHYDTTPTSTEFGTDPMDQMRYRAELPREPHLPPLGRLLAGPDGSLMVERPDLVDDPVAMAWTRLGPQASRWDLLDPDGRIVGRIVAPLRFSPHVLGEGWVLGTERDDLGVEYVVRYRIE